jgi:hypothetical protein
LATVGVALLAALVAVIGAAQAAPQHKTYSATAHVVGGDVSASHAKLRLILTNKTRSQTLGSANFNAPAGITPTAVVGAASRAGWTAAISGSTVMFRSTSNPLPQNQSVSADVSVSISQATCGSATWTTQAKQSNDFSGSGNDFQFDPQGSDLTPLGSFEIAPIQTIKDAQTIPAILTEVPHTSTTTARDLCENVKTSYTGAVRTQTLLTQATFSPTSGLSWSNGIGTVVITPEWTETGNDLTVTDPLSGVSATSNSFDTTDKLCTPSETNCLWEDEAKKILAQASTPPSGANIGIGFNSLLPFDCAGADEPVGGSMVNINPRGYTAPYSVSLTYQKSAIPKGPASDFDVCLSKDNGATWGAALSECAGTPVAPCILERKKVSGDLRIVLFLSPSDPWGGVG